MLIAPAGQRGMSLIELMIGLALVGIVMMVAMPSFSAAMQNRQIRNAADAIQSGLQLAKTEALRRNRNVNFVLTTGSSWKVGCATPDSTVSDGEVICPEKIQEYASQESSRDAQLSATERESTATGAAASTPKFADNTLTFTPLGRVDAGTLTGGNVVVFAVTNANGSCVAAGGEMRCLNVVVSSSGQVRMCDPAATTGDPRAC